MQLSASNTQINRLSMPGVPAIARLLVELGAPASGVADAADRRRWAVREIAPELLLQPLRGSSTSVPDACRRSLDDTLVPAGIALAPAKQHRLLRRIPVRAPLRSAPAATAGRSLDRLSRGAMASIGIEADGTLKGCPVALPTAAYARRPSARRSPRRVGRTRAAVARIASARSPICGASARAATTPRHVQGRLFVDDAQLARPAEQPARASTVRSTSRGAASASAS